ncbi:hypothetical protein thsrh120_43320 [Rhizobium sp. No.120]
MRRAASIFRGIARQSHPRPSTRSDESGVAFELQIMSAVMGGALVKALTLRRAGRQAETPKRKGE